MVVRLKDLNSGTSTPTVQKKGLVRLSDIQPKMKTPFMDIRQSPLMKQVQQSQPAEQPQSDNKIHIPALDFINNNIVEPVGNFLNRAATKTMDELSLRQGKKQLTNHPDNLVTPTFQNSLRPAATTAEKTADVIGSLYGSVAPIMGAYATGGKLFGMGLSKIAPNAPKIINSLVRGAGAGAAYGAATEGLDAAINPDDKTALQRLGGVGLDAAVFAGGDGALSAAGSGLKMIAQKYAGTKIGDVLGKFFDNSPKTAEPQPQENYTPPTRLKVKNAEDAFHSSYEKVLPQAVERMTPPLENPNELAKWVQGHLNDAGHDVSLNEVRNLNYEDLRQIAEEMRGKMNPADVVKNTAHDMGYGKLYDKSTPTIKERIAQDAQNQVYGIYPKKVNIAKPESFNTSKTAASAAPVQKQNWFTNLFGDQSGLGITPFGSKKRLSEKPLTSKDAIVSKGLVNSNEGIMNSAKSQLETAYTSMVDDLSPFKMVSHDAKEAAMDSRRSNNLANNIIREKFVTPEGKVVGPSMADTFLKVARGKGKDFVDYLIKRDAIDRVGLRGERVYDDSVKVYDPDTRQLVSLNDEKVLKREVAKDETKYPEFKDLGQEWNRFNDNMLQHYGVDMGMLTLEAKAAMQTARPNYIKTMRQFSLSEKPLKNITAKTRSGFSGQNLPIKRATGSGRNIVDPRKTMAEAVGGFVNASMRNRAMQEVYKEVVANPEKFKGVVEVVEESADASMKTLDEINKVITEDGMAGLTELFDSGYEAALKKGAQQGKDNVVTVMVEGKPVKLRVYNPSLINAVTGMGPQATSLLSNVLGAFSRATKRGATGLLAPTFITKSAIMDFPQAILQSENPIQQAGLSVYAVLSGIGDKLHIPGLRDMAREYRLAGGEFSPALKGESKLNKNVMDMTRYPILSGKNVIKQGLRTVSTPFKALEAAGSVLENAPRIAASKIVLNKAKNVKTPEVVRNAMSAGREATVNYLRKGRIGNEIENVVPYSNAAVQGTYRILKGFKNNPVRTIAAIGTLSVLPKMYEYMHFSDDPDYQKLPARERMRYLIVHKNEDGSFTKIPMDPAYNSFGEMTIELLRKFKDKDPQAFKGTADALANAWTPPFVTGALQGATLGTGAEGSIVGALNSTVAAPAVAIASNKSFTGAPIEPASVAGNSKGERYTDQTSDIAKAVGKKIGLSPLKTDYLLRSYGGDAARLGLPFNSNVGAGTPRNTLFKNFIVDPVLTNTLTNDYYGYKTRLNEVYQDNKDHDVPLPAWYDDNLRKEISSTAKGSLSSQVKDLTDQKKAVSANTLLSATEKAIKIRELQSQINKMYLDVNTKLSQKGVPTQ